MYKVIREFHDKYNLKKIYKAGDKFNSNEPNRIRNLLQRGLIERVDQSSYNSLTKKEIIKILKERNIEYDSRAKKEELIKLLEGD